jgi:hypothetical protein
MAAAPASVGPLDAVVHPLPFSPRADDTGVTEIGEMTGYLGLALFQYLHEVADADLSAVHQVEQPETRAVGQSGKQAGQVEGGGSDHLFIIYVLTDMSSQHIFAFTYTWRV